MDFKDCTLAIKATSLPDGSSRTEVAQVEKAPGNNCYIHIPTSLSFTPADDDVLRLRTFLCTTFAGQEAARKLTMSMEALSLFGKDMPQKMIVFVGKGGDGKSSLTKLRDSVFGGAHLHLSPEVFQVENEFRKQGPFGG